MSSENTETLTNGLEHVNQFFFHEDISKVRLNTSDLPLQLSSSFQLSEFGGDVNGAQREWVNADL